MATWSRVVTATLRKSDALSGTDPGPWMAYQTGPRESTLMGDWVREPLSETTLLGVWDGVCGPAREYVLRWLER